ncbi:MAG: hypothetical protein K9J25_05930 [Bacteroidales bacterium]|nr:hypothetical protein [Bacteroidales bacterium]
MKNILRISLILAVILFSVSCNKSETYPQGGDVDDAQVNLQKNWVLNTYFRNDVNETEQLIISSYSEEYTADGVYSRSYIKADASEVSEDGAYSFSDNMHELRISDVSSISDFSENNSTLSSSAYKILKLTESELWYSYLNGGDKHEFRFSINGEIK